jgi:hypothetical protein
MADARPVYSDDEVEEILRRAIEREAKSARGLRRDDLVAAAAEIGIDATYVDHAIDEIEAEKRAKGRDASAERAEVAIAKDEEEAIRRRLRHRFYRHALVWLVVSMALFMMNMWSSPNTWWFFWPNLSWGVIVAIHAIHALFPSEAKIEKEQWKKQRRASKRRRRDREFELAVERGVERMLTKSMARARVELPAAPKRVSGAAPEPDELEDDDTQANAKKRAAR